VILSRRAARLDPASLRLPLIALIDVVLFLLMYFLLAGSLAEEERQLAMTLQTSEGTGRASDFGPQILRVEMEGGAPIYRIGGRVTADRAVLAEILRPLPKDIGIVVRVADAAPVGAAAAAVQVCRSAGFTKISYVPQR
jgi:biopolymer transport protein ExbD